MFKTIKDRKTGSLIMKIDNVKKKIVYFVQKKSGQYNYVKKVNIVGFDKLPSGFNKRGYGFSAGGPFILSELREKFGKGFKLILVKTGKSEVAKTSKGKFKVIFNHLEFNGLMRKLKDINSVKNRTSKMTTQETLARLFPNAFTYDGPSTDTPYLYTDDKISKILNSEKNVMSKMSKNDVTKLFEIYPELIKLYGGSIDFSKTIQISKEDKQRHEKLYLEKLIREFTKKLKKKTSTESEWQTFLKDNILSFNTAYVGALDRKSISLSGKYPDFMLFDVYGYIDIFEIKKPSTNLLKFDDSRDNWFWDVELAKGISQTENYLFLLHENSLAINKEIKRSRNEEVNVVRPRGIIIAGTSEQFKNEKMRNDFRVLSRSMKDVEVILYDDLLTSLKNLYKRLGGKMGQKSKKAKFQKG